MKRIKKIICIVLVLCTVCGSFAVGGNAAAAYDANKIVSACEKAVGSSYPRGYCLAWVCDMFEKTYGYESTACCAQKYANTYTDSSSKNSIPLGADVFFSANNAVCSNCGRNCGHIGIYVGNGYIVHNWAGVIRKMTIAGIENSGYKFTGWGYHANKTLSSSTTPSAAVSNIKLGGTTPTLKTGVYYNLVNKQSGKYLNVYGSGSGNNVNVDIYAKDGTKGEKFNLTKVNSWFTLTPACAAAYRVNVYGTTSKNGANICLWKNSGNDTQGWVFEAVDGGYIIRSANNKNLVLTAAGTSNSSNVKLSTYSAGNKYQIWDFKAA